MSVSGSTNESEQMSPQDFFKILHLATTVEDVGVFEEAVRSGKCGINQLFYGFTPLMIVAGKGRVEVCTRLAALGADVNAVGLDWITALILAAKRNHSDCCTKLVELGADPNATDRHGWTALMHAVMNGNLELCMKLVELQGNPNLLCREETGDSALHLACRFKKLEVAKWLTEKMSAEAVLGLNEVWGISVWASCDPLVEDAEKEAFRAHVEALFADVL